MAKLLNQPPKYCRGAIASSLGWTDPKTGELLVSNKSLDLESIAEQYPDQVKKLPPKLTQEQLNQIEMDSFFEEDEEDVSVESDVSTDVESEEITETPEEVESEEVESEEVIETVDDVESDEVTETPEEVEDIIDYEEMTKAELLSFAKDTFDVDLPKSDNKTKLINKIKELNE